MKYEKKNFFLIFLRPFEQIKKAICSNFQFDRIRIVFGIDFSASNEWQGRKTFQGQPLHKTQGNKIFNPYQKVKRKIYFIDKNYVFFLSRLLVNLVQHLKKYSDQNVSNILVLDLVMNNQKIIRFFQLLQPVKNLVVTNLFLMRKFHLYFSFSTDQFFVF
jgi:hypothetical protein